MECLWFITQECIVFKKKFQQHFFVPLWLEGLVILQVHLNIIARSLERFLIKLYGVKTHQKLQNSPLTTALRCKSKYLKIGGLRYINLKQYMSGYVCWINSDLLYDRRNELVPLLKPTHNQGRKRTIRGRS